MSIKIALAGNPNCGKTTLFNALTGSNQYVGNWPGVTVEKKEGKLKGAEDVVIQDLPGIYSLSPYTLEEVVARSYLVGEKPDAILNIIDGTNIERNLYLTTQLIELGIPVVMAVNMIDLVRKNGDKIDLKKLSTELGCQAVEISALKDEGSEKAATDGRRRCPRPARSASCPTSLPAASSTPLPTSRSPSRARSMSASCAGTPSSCLSATRRYMAELNLRQGPGWTTSTSTSRTARQEMDDDAESIITNQRYAYINKCRLPRPSRRRPAWST